MKVNVALIQLSVPPTPDEALVKTIARVEEAAAAGAHIVCLQELFNAPYFCNVEDYHAFAFAETIPGPSTEALRSVAKKHGIVMVVPLFEKRALGLYHNSAAVIDADGSFLGTYRKMHIPDDPQYYEKFYFSPGDLGFKAFDTRYGRIGVLICWDQWFPEAARLTALQGATILFYPTAIGWHQSQTPELNRTQHEAWELMQRSHAVANGVFVAAPNRVGIESEQTFWGGSFVCGPSGKFLAKASHDKEEIVMATCDFKEVEVTRQHWPFLRDRRIDAYAGIEKRFID